MVITYNMEKLVTCEETWNVGRKGGFYFKARPRIKWKQRFIFWFRESFGKPGGFYHVKWVSVLLKSWYALLEEKTYCLFRSPKPVYLSNVCLFVCLGPFFFQMLVQIHHAQIKRKILYSKKQHGHCNDRDWQILWRKMIFSSLKYYVAVASSCQTWWISEKLRKQEYPKRMFHVRRSPSLVVVVELVPEKVLWKFQYIGALRV